MARIFLCIMLLMGGLLVAGATGDLVAAGRYDLLFGPSELAQSVSSLGDRVDDKMALQSALAREYGVTNIGQAIRLLEERYNAESQVIIPINLSIDIPINSHEPLDGVVAGGRVMKYLYPLPKVFS